MEKRLISLKRRLCGVFLVVVSLFMVSSCEGYKFYVGGRDGWVTHPSEDYLHWAQRMRFQVNDTLYFKYKKGNESVLMVTKENYNTCNTKGPIKTLSDGDSEFKFERSGPHYFISGNTDHCQKGQKLIIVVLAIRPKMSPPPPKPVIPAPTPAPVVYPTPTPSPASVAPPTLTPSPSPPAFDSPAPAREKSGTTEIGPSVRGLVSLALGAVVILGI